MRGGDRLLDGIPDGWLPSESVKALAAGGWWPGHWTFPEIVDSQILDILTAGDGVGGATQRVRWVEVGNIWEKDWFYTPVLAESQPSAPLLGFSVQALWTAMVFPTEAALLEAFLITYDEMGLDDRGEINPFFVEWVAGPPLIEENDGRMRVHERIVARSKEWATAHPCWDPSVMPKLDDSLWPAPVVARLLGVEVEDFPGLPRTWELTRRRDSSGGETSLGPEGAGRPA